ncbi:hypothetical protein FHG87_009310 [Trinorchestia longiramus]|nr:hypothetical protein FHG87_009310 [Trinorchestia longiramus]
MLKMTNIMLGEETEVKLSQIPLANVTISDRIEDMSKYILAQVVADLISSPAKFSLQVDETTDVSNLSQLAVLVSYVKDDVINEDLLFCKPLTTTTKAAEVKKPVDNFFKDNRLSCVFAVRVELALFLQEQQHCHADCFKNYEFILILVHLADIFAALNHLNHKMQGGGFNIIEAAENLKAFQNKLP